MSNGLGDYGHALSTLETRWIQGKFVIAYLLKMEAKDANGNVLGSMYDFIDFDENNQLKVQTVEQLILILIYRILYL